MIRGRTNADERLQTAEQRLPQPLNGLNNLLIPQGTYLI
jgi:hypothetical protein